MKLIPVITHHGQPVPLARHRYPRYGTPYLPAHCRNARQELRDHIDSLHISMIDEPVCVIVHFFFEIKKAPAMDTWKATRGDLDNHVKMVLDSIAWTERKTKVKRGILADDALVVELRATKKYCKKGDKPRTVIFIREPDTDGHQEAERYMRKIKQLRIELEENQRRRNEQG